MRVDCSSDQVYPGMKLAVVTDSSTPLSIVTVDSVKVDSDKMVKLKIKEELPKGIDPEAIILMLVH